MVVGSVFWSERKFEDPVWVKRLEWNDAVLETIVPKYCFFFLIQNKINTALVYMGRIELDLGNTKIQTI
jgi:hypothetical protein